MQKTHRPEVLKFLHLLVSAVWRLAAQLEAIIQLPRVIGRIKHKHLGLNAGEEVLEGHGKESKHCLLPW